MKIKLLILFFAIFLIAIIVDLTATPELALWSGNRCSECHIDAQGSAMRNEFGWTFGKDASVYTPGELGLDFIYGLDKSNYSFGKGWLAFGADYRHQTVRSHKTADAERKYFPMQASLYLNSNPWDWVLMEGKYNFGPKIFNGQTLWSASMLIKPSDILPGIRFGRFQPAMGIRDCDMTSLDRRVAAPDGTEVLIATDFAEYGVELVYESLDWLTVNVGVFDSQSLGEVTLFGGQEELVSIEGNPSANLRIVFWPTALYYSLPDMYIGASTLINGFFVYNTAFAGVGITDEVYIYAKYSGSNKPYIRNTDNVIAGLTFIPYKGIILGLRAEKGETIYHFGKESIELQTNQIVANARIMLLPYIEIIPEYRWMDTEEFHSLRWALQLHLYY